MEQPEVVATSGFHARARVRVSLSTTTFSLRKFVIVPARARPAWSPRSA